MFFLWLTLFFFHSRWWPVVVSLWSLNWRWSYFLLTGRRWWRRVILNWKMTGRRFHFFFCRMMMHWWGRRSMTFFVRSRLRGWFCYMNFLFLFRRL